MAAAAVVPVLPVSLSTDLGARVICDIGVSTLNLQQLENPQASLHNCATRYGGQYIRRMVEKLEEKGKDSVFETINLSDNLIKDEGAEWLQRGLAGNTNLRKLLLPRAGLGPAGFKSMGKLLAESPGIETLVLSSNTADSEGLSGDFCKGLAKNKSLKSLYLAVCRLGDEGIVSLCVGPLSKHPTLQHLSLEYNRLTALAAPTLSKVLATNCNLRYLDLCGNSLGPEGAEEIARGLEKNNGHLQQLGMAQNAIKLRGAVKLVAFFLSASGQNMEYLDIRHNRLGYHDMQKLRAETDMEKLKDEKSDGWLFLFNGCKRQLFANGSF